MLLDCIYEIPPVPIGAVPNGVVPVLTPVSDPNPVIMPAEPEVAREEFTVWVARLGAKSDPSTALLNGRGIWYAPVVVKVIFIPV